MTVSKLFTLLAAKSELSMQDTPLIIGSRSFQSRLLVGTGNIKT